MRIGDGGPDDGVVAMPAGAQHVFLPCFGQRVFVRRQVFRVVARVQEPGGLLGDDGAVRVDAVRGQEHVVATLGQQLLVHEAELARVPEHEIHH